MLTALPARATAMFLPPFSTPDQYLSDLAQRGFAVLPAAAVRALAGAGAAGLAALAPDWDQLAPDEYLKDGGRYRQRRHASFIVQGDAVQDVPYRPHWQPLDYNALHGGMERWFAPVAPATLAQADWRALLRWLARVADALQGTQPWYGEAHQFRIDTTDGIGRPTPEGAHRDGVDLVAVFLVAARHQGRRDAGVRARRPQRPALHAGGAMECAADRRRPRDS